MKKLMLLVTMIAFILATFAAVAVAQANAQAIPGKADLDKSIAGVQDLATAANGGLYMTNALVVEDDDGVRRIAANANALDGLKRAAEAKKKANPGLKVSPEYGYTTDATPDDPRWGEQGNYRVTGFQGAWDTDKGNGARACILDSGWYRGHFDLNDKVAGERDFIGDVHDGQAEDFDNGHGTHVAGIAAAETNNGGGVAGAGWNTSLLIGKIVASTGPATGVAFDSDIRQGLNWCMSQAGTVAINMSIGGPNYNADTRAKTDEVFNNGDIIVASAGNTGDSQYQYPASYPNVISVANVNNSFERHPSSTYNDRVDVAAPGVYIPSTYLNNGFTYLTGTSMSAPHVTGLASLMLETGPNESPLTNTQIRSRIFNNVTDLGPTGKDAFFGRGVIRAKCAVNPASC